MDDPVPLLMIGVKTIDLFAACGNSSCMTKLKALLSNQYHNMSRVPRVQNLFSPTMLCDPIHYPPHHLTEHDHRYL